MKRLITFAALALLLTSCNQAAGLGSKPTSKQNTQAQQGQFLLVILSNYGSIQKAPDGSTQLILDHGQVEKVLAFSNRPQRVVNQMTATELAQSWNQGPNSFSEDPPNATVVINQHLQTLILQSVAVTGDQTIFTIKADGPQSLVEMSGTTQLFIDGSISVTGCLNGREC